MADPLDPYRVLGVARGATKAQIKAAHRTLAKRFHPDSATGDARLFRDVHEAYQLLADPLRRREWDARHAPGPVRADQQPAAPSRRRRTTAAADNTAAPPTARTYRWSASEVPWWEEGVRTDNRRQPGARRPRAAADSSAPNADAAPTPATTARPLARAATSRSTTAPAERPGHPPPASISGASTPSCRAAASSAIRARSR